MNVLRSLGRDLWNVLNVSSPSVHAPEAGAGTLHAARQRPVPAVLGLSRFRDGFEKLPEATTRALSSQASARPAFTQASLQRDGFERARRFPVDLSGGFKPTFHVANEAPALATAHAPAFTASLADLGGLF